MPPSFDLLSTEPPERDTVLVLDSDPDLRQFLEQLLSPAGFRVVQVSSEQELFTMLLSVRPYLIVLDLGMLEVYGANLISLLRHDDERRPIPIVVTGEQTNNQPPKRIAN